MARVPSIVILGGGFSGVMTAAQILRRAKAPLLVRLIERKPSFGRGVAYGTSFAEHLLNVPAARMSAFPDNPGHFLRWSGILDAAFASRRDYSRYLRPILKEAAKTAHPGVRLELLRGEAIAAAPSRDAAEIALADGRLIRADRVVLALGHRRPGHSTGGASRVFSRSDRRAPDEPGRASPCPR